MAKKNKSESEVKQTKRGATIYIGKALLGLPRFTVFVDGYLPPHIAEMAKEDETILGLTVPIAELQEAKQNMLVKGHILNHWYNKQNKGR